MAASIKNPMDSDEAEPMRAEVFDIAVSALSFHGARQETPRIVQAARAVLVEGMRPGEAATQFEVLPVRVSETVGKIRDKWAAICEQRGLVTETFSLSPMLIDLIRQIELEALQPLQVEAAGRRKKRAATAKGPAQKESVVHKALVDKTSAPKTTAHKTPVQKAPAQKAPMPKVAEKPATSKSGARQKKPAAPRSLSEAKPGK